MKIKIFDNAMLPSCFMAGAEGSKGDAFLNFCLDGAWRGFDISVSFCTPSGALYTEAYKGEPLRVPDGVMNERGRTRFSVVGKGNGVERVTAKGELYVIGSVKKESESVE